ncbi:MAG: hypothetical protein WA137_12780 [Methanothrix sp.]
MAENMHWVFQSNNSHGNVVFNFRRNPINDFAPFAKGYQRAGKHLAEMLAHSPSFPDFEGYPILFLYRHALELYMKAIVYRGAQLLQLLDIDSPDTSRLFTDHRLSILLPGVKAIFDGIGWTWDTEIAGISNFEDFTKLVKGIEEIDPGSYSFRYPTNTKGKAALNHHTLINAIEFSRKMDPILDLLDTAVLGIHEDFDAIAEAKYELQSMIEKIKQQYD